MDSRGAVHWEPGLGGLQEAGGTPGTKAGRAACGARRGQVRGVRGRVQRGVRGSQWEIQKDSSSPASCSPMSQFHPQGLDGQREPRGPGIKDRKCSQGG